MAKRFTDSRLWEKKWFRVMKPDHKLFWLYLINTCDLAGVWDVDIELAEFKLGITINTDEFLEEIGERIDQINGSKWFLNTFIKFQYGELSDSCKPHIAVLKRLKELKIKGYTKGIHTLKDIYKDKDKDKEKEKKGKKQQIAAIKKTLKSLQSEFPEVEVKAEFDKWNDYLLATGKQYKNYNAAFRNWLRSGYVKKKEGTAIKKQKLICPIHPKVSVVASRGTFKFCPECRTPMKTESQIALDRVTERVTA